MALANEKAASFLKRFPENVRVELKRVLHPHSFKEFNIDSFTRLPAEALDNISELVDENFPEFQRDVNQRLNLLKKSHRGQTRGFQGRSGVGLRSFYRYWLIGQQNRDSLYDIAFCHISLKKEVDFVHFTSEVSKDLVNSAVSSPQTFPTVLELSVGVSRETIDYLRRGIFVQETLDNPSSSATPTAEETGNSYHDPRQDLGTRLIEYQLVEDLIERGMLKENSDGTLFLQL